MFAGRASSVPLLHQIAQTAGELALTGEPPDSVWVPRTRSRRATCPVLVYEAAESISSAVVGSRHRSVGEWLLRAAADAAAGEGGERCRRSPGGTTRISTPTRRRADRFVRVRRTSPPARCIPPRTLAQRRELTRRRRQRKRRSVVDAVRPSDLLSSEYTRVSGVACLA